MAATLSRLSGCGIELIGRSFPRRPSRIASSALPDERMRMAVDLSAPSIPVEAIAAAAAAVDRDGRFPREAIDALAAEGALALGIPAERSGSGGGPREIVEAVEAVAGACASAGMVYVMHLVATQTLLAGTPHGEEGPKA